LSPSTERTDPVRAKNLLDIIAIGDPARMRRGNLPALATTAIAVASTKLPRSNSARPAKTVNIPYRDLILRGLDGRFPRAP
jgi:hypothetical protein